MKKYRIILLTILFVNCIKEDEYNTPEVAPVVCSETSLVKIQPPFIENFEKESTLWIQKIESSERYWEKDQQNGNHAMSLSAFRENNTPIGLKTWLISPIFNVDQMKEKVFSFSIADAYQNGNPFHVYFSNDYDGKKCPLHYAWTEIAQEEIEKLINNSGTYDNFFEWSENISLEKIKGKGVLAFVYQSENTISTTVQLDDIVIGKKVTKPLEVLPELIDGEIPYLFTGGALSNGNLIQKDLTGSLKWKTHNEFISASGYGTKEKNTVYLITPRFDFELQENEILTFETKDQYDNGKVLNVYYSTDFDGTNYESASWTTLKVPHQSDTDGIDTPDFIKSESIDLSFIKEKAVIAFVYTSNASESENKPGPTTFLNLSNIKIEPKPIYNLFFSEIADPKDNVRARFVELFNSGNNKIDLSEWKLNIYKNGKIKPESTSLSGIVYPKSYFLIGNDQTDYTKAYPEAPIASLFSNKITGNGDDVYELVHEDYVVDIYGVIGEDGTGEDWEYTDGKAIRKTYITQSNDTWILNEWNIIKPAHTKDMSPGTSEKVNPINNPPIAAVLIEGETKVEHTLYANTKGSMDEENDPLTFSYQWYKSDNPEGKPSQIISEAIESHYKPISEDEGKYLSVKVVANDGKDDSDSIFANYVGPIEKYKPITEGVFISEIADPDNNVDARFIELYNANSIPVNLNGWKLKRYTNENIEITSSATLLIEGVIDAQNTFVIAKNAAEFERVYGFPPHQDGKEKGAVDSNGDDQIILESPNGLLIDIFGVIGEDGSNTNHEFEDGRANRKLTVTKGNTSYSFPEWDIWNDTGNAETINKPQNAPQDFTPRER
ncbi:MAG: lamin tail domain-containing protein [Flavobacteriales bacterium]